MLDFSHTFNIIIQYYQYVRSKSIKNRCGYDSGILNRDIRNGEQKDKFEIRDIDLKLAAFSLDNFKKKTEGTTWLERATQPMVDIYDFFKPSDTCPAEEENKLAIEENEAIKARLSADFIEVLITNGFSQEEAESQVNEAINEVEKEGSALKGVEVAAVGIVAIPAWKLTLLGFSLLSSAVAQKLIQKSPALREKIERFASSFASNDNNDASIYSTPAHPDEGLDLRTPVHEPKADKEGFDSTDGKSQQTPGFEVPEYDFKIPGFEG